MSNGGALSTAFREASGGGEGTVLTLGTLSEGGDTHLLSGATNLGTDSETCPKAGGWGLSSLVAASRLVLRRR